MRHRKAGRKLGRTAAHRSAMLRNMVTSLFEHERIVTTVPKAKEARRVADKMITLAKRGDLHARRQAFAYIQSKDVVAKLFDHIHTQFTDRQGGYTRIIRTGTRLGDAAPMAILELVGYEESVEPADTGTEE
ncbi:MAG: 50S ribosomal protein L17 [Desulfobulbaceae bacterium]|nr:50S ribosomal protein L17 [Desulfobulbaceae bacterium]